MTQRPFFFEVKVVCVTAGFPLAHELQPIGGGIIVAAASSQDHYLSLSSIQHISLFCYYVISTS